MLNCIYWYLLVAVDSPLWLAQCRYNFVMIIRFAGDCTTVDFYDNCRNQFHGEHLSTTTKIFKHNIFKNNDQNSMTFCWLIKTCPAVVTVLRSIFALPTSIINWKLIPLFVGHDTGLFHIITKGSDIILLTKAGLLLWGRPCLLLAI